MKNQSKKLNIVKIKPPKVAKFDLSMTKSGEDIRVLAALESLKFNPGWHFMLQVFGENIKDLEKQILTKQDNEGKPLTDAQVDLQRMKYGYLRELIEKPDYFITKLSREDLTPINHDPYN